MITEYAVTGDVIYDFNERVFNDYDPRLKNFFREIRFTFGWLNKNGYQYNDDGVVGLDLRDRSYALASGDFTDYASGVYAEIRMDCMVTVDDVVAVDKKDMILRPSYVSDYESMFSLARVKRELLVPVGAELEHPRVKIILKNIVIALECKHRFECRVCASRAKFVNKMRWWQKKRGLELTPKYVSCNKKYEKSCECAKRVAGIRLGLEHYAYDVGSDGVCSEHFGDDSDENSDSDSMWDETASSFSSNSAE